MTQCGRQTSYQQRIEIGERAAAGLRDPQIAAEIGCSVWTVRKWRRRFQRAGPQDMRSQLGRPAQGALAQTAPDIRTQIVQLRQAHPGWGAASLLDYLVCAYGLAAAELPSRARVAAFLHAHGLTRHYERHGGLPAAPSPAARQAHDEWEVDAQGAQAVTGLGAVRVINICDVVSRLKVESYPSLGAHLDWHVYQLALRRSFSQFGLPVRITVDHDSVFYDNTSPSPFPTRLHLWLVALGIEVAFISKPPPQAHAMIERTHQTLSAQALTGQCYERLAALWYELDQRREALNARLPCRSLHREAPLTAHPAAATSPRPYRLEWEEAMLDLTQIHRLLATGRWFRQASCRGQFGLGMQRYNVGVAHAQAMLEIHFDPASLEFVAHIAGTAHAKRYPALGLTKAELMGDWPDVALPNYQFALPFTLEDWRKLELASCARGTIL